METGNRPDQERGLRPPQNVEVPISGFLRFSMSTFLRFQPMEGKGFQYLVLVVFLHFKAPKCKSRPC